MFSQKLWHAEDGCGISDYLSGDMLAPSWPRLVL